MRNLVAPSPETICVKTQKDQRAVKREFFSRRPNNSRTYTKVAPRTYTDIFTGVLSPQKNARDTRS